MSSAILLCNFGALLFSFRLVLFKKVCVFVGTHFFIFSQTKNKQKEKKVEPDDTKKHKKTVWIKKNEAFVVPVFLFEERPRRGNDDRETPPSRKTSSSSASSRRSEDTGVGFNVFFRQ